MGDQFVHKLKQAHRLRGLSPFTVYPVYLACEDCPRLPSSAQGRPAGWPGSARGSGALCGYADILLEMHWYANPGENDRRRRLYAYSRFEETPRDLVIELTADGTDYLGHGDGEEVAFGHSWQLLRGVLEQATGKLTRPEIRAQWPAEERAPDVGTLWRWLERAVAGGQVLRDGAGHRNDPYRYWLPGQEQKWRQSPCYVPELPELKRAQQVAEEVRRRLLEGLAGMEG